MSIPNSLVQPDNVKGWIEFKIDKLNLNALGEYRPEAVKFLIRLVGNKSNFLLKIKDG